MSILLRSYPPELINVKPSFFCETFPANFEYQLILYYHKHNTLSLKLCGSIVCESRKEF